MKTVVTRELLIHQLYEAAELEHTLMCTYLYAAFSLKSGVGEGLSVAEAEAVARWRRAILDIAVGEMGHLVAVWNITSALGGVPRFGRGNFPLDPGNLPAGIVVKLAPFNRDTLQHFIHLERPHGSHEADGDAFAPEFTFRRGTPTPRVTPMALDYETVGDFYMTLSDGLRAFAERVGEREAFCGDPALQLSQAEVVLAGAARVICAKTALAAFDAIVAQGEGAREDSRDSHFAKFAAMRGEYAALLAQNPSFEPAFPAARNPVLRRPPKPEGRIWIENEEAAATVDVANSAYGLMLRLIAYAYSVPAPAPEKALAVDTSIALMRALTLLGERAARLPAGPTHPECHAGVSFITLRDAAPLPLGAGARRFFIERLQEVCAGAHALPGADDRRVADAQRLLDELRQRAERGFARAAAATPQVVPAPVRAALRPSAADVPASGLAKVDGVEIVAGGKITVHYEGKRCIHARFCVTGAPTVFLANVQGPWIHPDTMDAEEL
ncbi:MAG: ferritin-like domain-containing protein, partial [Rudaea sp.]